MSQHLPVDDPRAVKAHARAIAEHDRAWQQMHDTGVEHGTDSPEYEAAREYVRQTRREMTCAAQAVRRSRSWLPHVPRTSTPGRRPANADTFGSR